MPAPHNFVMAHPALPRSPVCLGNTVLVADVGISRIKLGVIADHGDGTRLPVIIKRHDLESRSFRPDTLEQWLHGAAPGPALILVASVHDAAAARLEAAIAALSVTQHRPLRQRRISHADMPLVVSVAEPHRVGIDRLAGAAAARLVKPADRPAIIVDCGTAATVNLVSAGGEFLGGAILPGPALMTKALAEGTSRLPEVAALEQGIVPAMPGRSTQEAIAAGVGWGMRGAVARLVEEAKKAFGDGPVPELILTGGWRGAVREAIPGAIDVPDLVLCGIALAADRGS